MAGTVTGLIVIDNLPGGSTAATVLDNNYTALANAINATLTCTNFYVDQGSINAVAVTIPAPQIWQALQGQQLAVFIQNTNTGTTSLTVNGTLIGPILNQNGSALASGSLLANSVAMLQFVGPNTVILINPFTVASGPTLGSFVGIITGVSGGPTAIFNYSISGNVVVVDCGSGLTGTSTSTQCSITGLPLGLNPVRQQNPICWVVNNGLQALGQLAIQTNGLLILATGTPPSQVGFTAAGSKGIGSGFVFSYNLA